MSDSRLRELDVQFERQTGERVVVLRQDQADLVTTVLRGATDLARQNAEHHDAWGHTFGATPDSNEGLRVRHSSLRDALRIMDPKAEAERDLGRDAAERAFDRLASLVSPELLLNNVIVSYCLRDVFSGSTPEQALARTVRTLAEALDRATAAQIRAAQLSPGYAVEMLPQGAPVNVVIPRRQAP